MFIIDHCISGDGDGVDDNLRDMIRNQVCANENFVLCDRCTPTSLQRRSAVMMRSLSETPNYYLPKRSKKESVESTAARAIG